MTCDACGKPIRANATGLCQPCEKEEMGVPEWPPVPTEHTEWFE